ncbi:MAG: DUF2490 domain-containing protein [Candidatus Sulfotelmatobacter sp.]
MRRLLSILLGPCLFLALLPWLATAQTLEFLPEIDAVYKLNSTIRFDFQAKQTRENGDPTQAEIGPSVDFLAKPLIKLKRTSRYDPDESKQRALALSFGYRYLPSPDTATVQRVILAATPNLPLMAGLLLSDRNRGELNSSSNGFDWRYRNRLNLQRTFDIYSHHPIPYASVELFYDSKYQKWSSTALYAGCRIPFGRSVQVDSYYEHENNTGKAPNPRVNVIGLILGLYF